MPGCAHFERGVKTISASVQRLSQPHAVLVMVHLLRGFSLGDGLCGRGVKVLRK